MYLSSPIECLAQMATADESYRKWRRIYSDDINGINRTDFGAAAPASAYVGQHSLRTAPLSGSLLFHATKTSQQT